MNTVDNEKCCPLCGKPNHCTMATRPTEQQQEPVPCWCRDIGIPEELRKRIPVEAKMKACICQSCINTFKAQQLSS